MESWLEHTCGTAHTGFIKHKKFFNMAKDIIFRAKLDTKQAEANARNLGQNINKSVSETTGVDKLSQRMSELNKNIDEGNLSIRQYRTAIYEYQQIAIQAGLESPIGKQALERAALLKDTYSDMQQQVLELSQDHRKMNLTMQGVNVAVNSYQAFTGVMGLLGDESEKYLQIMSKMMIVQQSHNALLQVAQAFEEQTLLGQYARITANKLLTASQKMYTMAVGTSTGAMKAFRVALMSTGIGALVVALGMLIGNFDKVVEVVKKVVGWLSDFGKAVGKLFGGIFKSNKDLVDSNAEVEKSEKQLAREHKKALRERERANKKAYKAMQDDIKDYVEALKENEREYKKTLIQLDIENANEIERNNAQIDLLTANLEKSYEKLAYLQMTFTDKNGKFISSQAETAYKLLEQQVKNWNNEVETLKNRNSDIEAENKKQEAAEQAAAQRREERRKREQERLQKLADEYEDFTDKTNEILAESNEYNKSLEEEKLMSNLDTFGKIEHLRNKDLESVEEWYLEQVQFLEQYKDDKEKYDKALEQLEQARLVKRADINTKYDIELEVERQKFEENYTKFLEKQEQERLQQTLEALKEREDKTAYLQESFRIKQQEIEDKYKELLEEARIMEDEQALANLQALKDEELRIIQETYDKEIEMNKAALEQMRKDRNQAAILMNVEYSEKILGGLSQIFASMSQMSEENSKQQKTLAMVSLALNQAAAMGAAVRAAIDGAKDMPDPISKIAYFVTTLATFMGIIASTISQAKQIANSGNISVGGGINPALTNNVNQNYNAVQENRATEPPPQRVYVLESDITSTQNRIRRISVNQVL